MEDKQSVKPMKVSKDGMRVTLNPSRFKDIRLSLSSFTKMLNNNNIVFGIDKQALADVVENGFRDEKELIIAQGALPESGKDAEIVYCFRREQLQTGELPIADFHEKGKIQLRDCKMAKKNEVLAVKLRATEGKPGKNVFGEEIPAQPGQDADLEAGKNIQTRFYPDKIEYSALCEGIVQIHDDRLEVNSLCIIDHDVDLSTGNVEFVGSLLILGNVLKGFSVKSQGSIKVQGNIDGGSLRADGDVIVKGSISGSSDVRAGGKIKAQFVEHSRLEAMDDILVDDGIVHSEALTSGFIIVDNNRGTIAGGKFKARKGVTAKVIGSAMATPTDIAIGKEFIENKQSQRIQSELHALEQEINRLQNTLKPFIGKDPTLGSIQPEKRWVLKNLANRLKELKSKRRQIQAKLATYDRIIKTGAFSHAQIRVKNVAHKGVKIQIGSSLMTLDQELNHVAIMKNPGSQDISVVDLDQLC